jgi:hypothetical protein
MKLSGKKEVQLFGPAHGLGASRSRKKYRHVHSFTIFCPLTLVVRNRRADAEFVQQNLRCPPILTTGCKVSNSAPINCKSFFDNSDGQIPATRLRRPLRAYRRLRELPVYNRDVLTTDGRRIENGIRKLNRDRPST